MSAQAVLQHESYEIPSVGGEAKLRLTRRGRLVFGSLLTVLVAALLAMVATFAAPQALASVSASEKQQFHYVVAQPGSSLWTLATELDPQADPRELVAEIVRLNQLDGSGIEAGDAIAVPLRYSDSPAVFQADELGV